MAFREQAHPWHLFGPGADLPADPLHLGYLYFATDNSPTGVIGGVSLPSNGGVTGPTGAWVLFAGNANETQRGHAQLVTGTALSISATISALSVIKLTRRQPLGQPHDTGVLQVTAPAYGATGATFNVASLDSLGAVETSDTDGFDWAVIG